MRFTTRGQLTGTLQGPAPQSRHGGAGEFVDFREYGSGEDLRRLDWKVFARTGKAFVRLHQDETNLLCTLAIDNSRSMDFPGQSPLDPRGSKLTYVRYLATALSHVISLGQDQVGVAMLGRKPRHDVAAGRNAVARARGCSKSSPILPRSRPPPWPGFAATVSKGLAAAAC